MLVTPFRVYSSADCDELAEALTPVVQQWSRRWFGRDAGTAEFRNYGEADDSFGQAGNAEHMLLCGDLEAPWYLLWRADENKLGEIAGLMLRIDAGAAQTGQSGELLCGLHRDMTRTCLQDLGNAVVGAQASAGEARVTGANLSTALRRASLVGTGWGVLSVRCEALVVDLLLGPSALETRLPLPPVQLVGDLASAKLAIVGQQASLTATLGATTLTIGQFEKLQTGDVVKLDQAMADPVRLMTSSGEEVARGQLGVREGQKAVRLGLATDFQVLSH